jgi:hypothetical protein
MKRGRGGWGGFAVALVLGIVLAATALALAAGTTRDEYVAAVEPICKRNTEANERIFAGVRREVLHGQLASAATKFARGTKALRRTLGELKAVPRPAADRARLKDWFAAIEVEVGLFARTARYLREGEAEPAIRMSAKLSSAANEANNVVFEFEFRYCRAEPSRFM